MDEYNELDSTCGVSDEELTIRFREAVRIENEIKSYFNKMIESYLDFYEINKKVKWGVEYNIDGEIQINIAYE